MENIVDTQPAIKRTRRHYPDELKWQVVSELTTQRLTIRQVADRHNVSPSLIRRWQKERERLIADVDPKSKNSRNAFVALEPTPSVAVPGERVMPTISVTIGAAQHPITLDWPASQMNELAQFVKALQQ